MITRLKDLREDHDLKQKDIADMFKDERSTYAYYETGKVAIPINKLCILADFYNVSTDYIMFLTDKEKTIDEVKINTKCKVIRTRLRELRNIHKLKQSYLAKLINKSQNTYSYYDLNLRNVPTDDLIVFCKFYKVSLDYMLYRTNNIINYPDSIIRQNIEKLQNNIILTK